MSFKCIIVTTQSNVTSVGNEFQTDGAVTKKASSCLQNKQLWSHS